MLQGSILTQYQIGKMLDQAGLRDDNSQLMINIGINSVTLVVSILGSFYADKVGAKSAALLSTAGATVTLVIIGALTKIYGDTDYKPGIYANVATIFLFSASYAFGWIPILFLVPAEMLNFSIRALGMSMFSLVVCVTGIWGNFALFFALERIDWEIYMINAAWNVGAFAFIAYYWVEIRGKTLEEIDVLFDGVKHSNVPDVAEVLSGSLDGTWKEKCAQWMGVRFPRGLITA